MFSWKSFCIIAISLLLLLALFFPKPGGALISTKTSNQPSRQNNPHPTSSSHSPTPQSPSKQILWGVDSAAQVDIKLLQCVDQHFGSPDVYGRYLGSKQGISQGLTIEEANLLHSNHIKILLVYNQMANATGYGTGVNAAKDASNLAIALKVPKGIAIFADVEPTYPVDSAFINGWFDGLKNAGYVPGLYGVMAAGTPLAAQWNAAVKLKPEIQQKMILWSASPQHAITVKGQAPPFGPDTQGNSLTFGWQYGQNAQPCTIDENLFKVNLANYLW